MEAQSVDYFSGLFYLFSFGVLVKPPSETYLGFKHVQPKPKVKMVFCISSSSHFKLMAISS
jgi:hypothetical protein